MLSGQTVLIVEEEFLIALDIQGMLEALSAGSMLFARSAMEAHQNEQLWSTIDLAILEIGADHRATAALFDELRSAGIAIILTTTDGSMRQGHPDYPGTPVLLKPMIQSEMCSAVARALPNAARTNDCAS